jgi:hypothetical protein
MQRLIAQRRATINGGVDVQSLHVISKRFGSTLYDHGSREYLLASLLINVIWFFVF